MPDVSFNGGSFKGGDALRAKLKEIAAKAGKGGTLTVGFMSGATEADGTSVPLIAASNEFGATIPARQVDEHVITIYNSIKKNGDFSDGKRFNPKTGKFVFTSGLFVKKSQANLARQATVPAHIIPAHKVPPRPFFRRMISLGKGHWADDLGKIMVATGYDGKLSLGKLGEKMIGELQQSILDQVYAPLAPSTARAKGVSATLVDTSQMLKSVDASVTE